MSDKLLRTAVNAQARLRNWGEVRADALRRRADEGQSAVEYMGIIAVVVAIILVLLGTNLGATIAAEIVEQVESITG
ncbi:hypothetical protein CUT44_16405 [Streptomyces carminius]|uniref:Flp family type IVb pilin n=1 Tax=Streptomyces carminius TaxID=2665496 RepID=A0A2M8LXD1_9ACTN|nr:hypothetical protein [Streptomyces carminius]PJE96627.1 hypothetical protein CUT44_16405 [Streptomyces carminius]